MDDLVTWLRAQLDEDERVMRRILRFSREGYAQGAYESWVAERKFNHVEPPYYDYQSVRTERTATRPVELVRLDLDLGGYLADHIARFGSPARVLTEVATKRAILDRYDDARSRAEDHEYSTSEALQQIREYEDFVIPNLAMVYADRPDYKPEWRP